MDATFWIELAVFVIIGVIVLDYARKHWYSPVVDDVSTARLNDPRVHPAVCTRVSATIEDCAAVGIYLRVTRAAASPNEQHALFIQGREPLDVVNEARAAVKWPPVTMEGNIEVTDADYLLSMHVYGLAADIAPSKGTVIQPFDPDWNNQDAQWQKVLQIAASHRLAEGAKWTAQKRDYPHLYPQELDANPTPEMMQDFKDGGLSGVWANLNFSTT